jgi:gamma-glutamylcyclotransferase (GGCT)/AIG2-like uncharacterized protein YtfP
MATDYVFAYGSSMNRSELRSWLEAGGQDSSLVVNMFQARLEGYDIVWNYYSQGRGGGTANLERKDGATVWGILIEIDEDLLKVFDRKEGHPYFYARGETRIPVTRTEDGKSIPAWVYIAEPNRHDSSGIKPTRDYKRTLIEAAIFWNFPESYIDKMKDWPTS